MRYTAALAVLAVVLAGLGVAAAEPLTPDLSGRWVVTTTVTRGNSIDQARIGQSTDLSCAQSAAFITCWGREGNVLLTGKRDAAAVRITGKWEPDGVRLTIYGESNTIRMTLDGQIVNATSMQGRFNVDMIVGLGTYKASGEWRATKAAN